MSQQNNISIKLSEQEVVQNLRQFITGDHADLVSEAILGLIDDSDDRAKLFKATLGIEPLLRYKVGDRVSIPIGKISTYSWNESAMVNEGLISNDRIDGTIKEVRKWDYGPYVISHLYISDSDGKSKTTTFTVIDDHLSVYERWPE
jgi:hypothetical protein